MKAILLASTMLFAGATLASADQVLNLTESAANVELSFETLNGEDYFIGAEVAVLDHSLFAGTSGFVTLGVDYDLFTESTSTNIGYVIASDNDVWGWYVEANANYVADASNFGEGVWYFTPVAGAQYTVSAGLDAFVEVGASWDIANDFADQGQYAQLGVNYLLADNVVLVPSVIQEFNTGNDDLTVGAEIAITF